MVADLYKTTVPCERSAIDLLVRAKNKDTGASLKTHHIVAQANSILVGGEPHAVGRGGGDREGAHGGGVDE